MNINNFSIDAFKKFWVRYVKVKKSRIAKALKLKFTHLFSNFVLKNPKELSTIDVTVQLREPPYITSSAFSKS